MGLLAYPARKLVQQCSHPSGPVGRLLAKTMNKGHGPLTMWGLAHISIPDDALVLDIGCGGGATVGRLAAMAPLGKVCGVDLSPDSVKISRRTNRSLISQERVEIRRASVEELPYAAGTFDLVTAIETHFFWPDLPANFGEVLRVLRPGGQFMILAEAYKGSPHHKRDSLWVNNSEMAYLGKQDFEDIFATAGFGSIEVACDPKRGRIRAMGRKPAA